MVIKVERYSEPNNDHVVLYLPEGEGRIIAGRIDTSECYSISIIVPWGSWFYPHSIGRGIEIVDDATELDWKSIFNSSTHDLIALVRKAYIALLKLEREVDKDI
ncbi:hypothetical protein HYV88_04100 [Candidatus Woesearchaeota archaeon]|nr:hypothetical protein [Candidatus Woesearchaeota archaeon]